MAFSFSSTGGSSGVTSITVSATSTQELVDIVENFTLSNTNKSLLMPITQRAYEPLEKYIIFNPISISVDSSGGTASLNIQSNDNWVITADDWIQLSRFSEPDRGPQSISGNGNTIVGIRFYENTGSSRNGGITGYCISDSSITATTTVSQDGSYIKPYINLGYYSVTTSSESSTTAVSVSSNIDWYTICDSRWITLATQSGSGDGSISFTVDANTTEFNREGIITVFNAEYDIYVEFVVRQVSSVKPFIALDPQSFVVAGSGSTNTISVSANCDYDITTDVDWIVLGASSGTGYGSVTFTTQANNTNYQDTGNIVFSNSAVSSYVSVVRRPVEKYLSASTSSISTSSSGGDFEVYVYSNINWDVRVDMGESEVSDRWLSVSPSSGSNDGSIRISVGSGITSASGSVVLINSQYGLSWNIGIEREKFIDSSMLLYTSSDGNIITPNNTTGWGVNIVSNIYENGQGVIQFDGNITSIPNFAFFEESRLTSVSLPNGLVSIGDGAFSGCGLTGSLTIPNSVTRIGIDAFNNCSGLVGSLVIPNSVETIGADAFGGCVGFNGSLTIGSGVTSIGDMAFVNCRGFTGDLVIPDSVTTIGTAVFYGCSGFNGVLTLSNSLTLIPASAFTNCSGFTGSLTIPNSVTRVNNYAFANCCDWNGGGFTSLTIGSSVSTLSNYAFEYCQKITEIYSYPTNQPSTSSSVFYGLLSGGTLHYPRGSWYSTFISRLPNGWTTVGDL